MAKKHKSRTFVDMCGNKIIVEDAGNGWLWFVPHPPRSLLFDSKKAEAFARYILARCDEMEDQDGKEKS